MDDKDIDTIKKYDMAVDKALRELEVEIPGMQKGIVYRVGHLCYTPQLIDGNSAGCTVQLGEQTKMSRFILEGPRPCTIFYFVLRFVSHIFMTFTSKRPLQFFHVISMSLQDIFPLFLPFCLFFFVKFHFSQFLFVLCHTLCMTVTYSSEQSKESEQKHTTQTFAGFHQHSLPLTLCMQNKRCSVDLRNN